MQGPSESTNIAKRDKFVPIHEVAGNLQISFSLGAQVSDEMFDEPLIAILTVTSSIVINVGQPEVYWLSKQRTLLFCGWQSLNIKRLVCKHTVFVAVY